MKLKVDAQGQAVLQDGKPVYIKDDGSEIAMDVPEMHKSIAARNAEAKANRERAEKAESLLKNFEGIDDAEAARKAMQTIKNIDAKKLIDAGEVDKVRETVKKELQAAIDAEKKRADDAEGKNTELLIGGSFQGSKFVQDKLSIPADFVRSQFGSAFKVENGAVVGYVNGNRIPKGSNPGEAADFDEALAYLVSQHPQKDRILKADNKGGSGAPNNTGGGGGQVKANLTGTQEERVAAIASRFPDLPAK